MTSSLRPPTFIPTTPSSQPGMTWPAPSVKENGWDVHEDWTTFPLEYVASTYCTWTLSPFFAAGPVPAMRSELSRLVGGVPLGTTTVGWVPAVPAGDGSETGTVTTVVGGVVLGGEPVVLEADELLHAANPTADADSMTIDHLRRRGMERDPFLGREACDTAGRGHSAARE